MDHDLVQEITAAAANGAKAKFERISAEEPAKMRRVALNTATQQNLANCVALLKEVAVHFGYSLAIEDGPPPLLPRLHHSRDNSKSQAFVSGICASMRL